MAEPQNITFTHQELAEALVKRQGIHEGIWGIYLEFGIAGANVGRGPDDMNILPAAIVPVVKIGIQRFPKVNNLSVDASKVNPARRNGRKKPPTSKKRTAKAKVEAPVE